MKELGDRFKHYDSIAEQHDRRARQVDYRSITNSFSSAGDACSAGLEAMFSDALGESQAGKANADAPIKLSLELAMRHAAKRADFLGLNGTGLQAALDKGAAYVMKGVDLCESPIEKRIIPWLVFEDYGPLLTFPAVVHDAKTELEVPPGDIMIVPQFAFAKFRLDFGVIARWKLQTKIVAVECDGESYHGAKRDRARDAYLASWGIPTVRASGREIFNEPRTLSARAASIISDWALEL